MRAFVGLGNNDGHLLSQQHQHQNREVRSESISTAAVVRMAVQSQELWATEPQSIRTYILENDSIQTARDCLSPSLVLVRVQPPAATAAPLTNRAWDVVVTLDPGWD